MKTKTMQLQGKEYAQVKDRLMEFRQENPRGLIETTPTIQADGQIIFKTRIVKDKSDEFSSEATGHALGTNKGQKAFEKLETISVGRALAFLGYASDGEIASSEEQEEFEAYKKGVKQKEIDNAKSKLQNAKTTTQLQQVWSSIVGDIKPELMTFKDELKAKLIK